MHLTEQEIHNMAMQVVGELLKEDGFEFLAVNSKLKKDPQFVCLKEKSSISWLLRDVCIQKIPSSMISN